jgi:hypothetical protein
VHLDVKPSNIVLDAAPRLLDRLLLDRASGRLLSSASRLALLRFDLRENMT